MKRLQPYLSSPVILNLFLFFLIHLPASAQTSPSAELGVLDLRELNFQEKNVPLRGEWQFYWKQLVTGQKGHDVLYPHFPSLWSNIKDSNDYAFPSKGYCTFRLKILVPPVADSLGLEIPDMYGSYTLFANGRKISEEGTVDSSAGGARLAWKTKVVPLPLNGDTLQLDLQVSNFQLAKGGVLKDILIGTYHNLSIHHLRNVALDWVIAGCLFMGGLFFIGLFLFGTRDKAILFFSLFSIVYGLRITSTNNYVLQEVFPSLSWQFLLHLEYLTVSVPAILFSYYVYYLYPKDIHKPLLRIFAGISLAYTILILFTPVSFFTAVLPYYLGIVLSFIAYSLVIFTLAAMKKRPGADFGLWSNIVAINIFTIIILNYFELIPPLRLVQVIGYIIFFFLQSLILSKRFSHVLILAKKEAEAGLVEKSNFLSVMSHEIRTPLNAVIGISEMMKSYKMSEQEMKDNVELLSFSANNLLAIINDILDFNKIDAKKVTFEKVEVDINSIINNVVKSNQSIAGKKSIKLNLFINSNVPKTVIGDPLRLTQVLNNLLNNAIKFTDYGYVTITADRVVRSNEKVSVDFKVIDTGIGIEENKLGVIFEAFAQADSSTARSYGGTGLGLAITSRILALQGTELKVESKPGRGSVFYFTVDFDKYVGTEETPVVIKQEYRKPVKKDISEAEILLTEDNELNIIFTKKYLEKWGAKVSVAHNGQEAVDMFSNKHDIILMDLQMPGMDGFEASGIIRNKDKQIPIIAFTANTEDTVREKILLAGMNDMISKPFAPDMLKNLILKYLHN